MDDNDNSNSSSISMKDWPEQNFIINTHLQLSKNKIPTTFVNFEKTTWFNNSKNDLDIENTKMALKPMSVFLLNSKKSMDMMSSISAIYQSKLANLILFLRTHEIDDTEEKLLFKFCMKPVGNPLGLRIDRQFLVRCYKNDVIDGWNPINSEKISVFKWATWRPKWKPFIRKQRESFKDLNQLNGKLILRGAVQEHDIFANFTEGFLLALQEAANFTTKTVATAEEYGNWDAKNQNGTGGYGLLLDGKVDFMASFYLMNPSRAAHVDFTIPIRRLEICLCMKVWTDTVAEAWHTYTSPFSIGAWGCILWVFIGVHIMLTSMRTLYERRSGKKKYVIERIMNVWSCYCQQGVEDFPEQSAIRMTYCTTLLFAFTIIGVYSACFVSDLADIEEVETFETMRDFLMSGSYRFAALRETEYNDFFQNETDSPWVEMKKESMKTDKLPVTLEQAAKMICDDNVVFLTHFFDASVIEHMIKPCKILTVKTGRYYHTGMLLKKGSPYKKAIDYHIARLRDTGILNYFNQILDLTRFNLKTIEKGKYNKVSFWHISPLLTILSGTGVLSVVMLFVENAYYYIIDKRKNGDASKVPLDPTERSAMSAPTEKEIMEKLEKDKDELF